MKMNVKLPVVLFSFVSLASICLPFSTAAAKTYAETIIDANPLAYFRLGEAPPITDATTVAVDAMGNYTAIYYKYPHYNSAGGVIAGLPGAIPDDTNTAVEFAKLNGDSSYSHGGAVVMSDASAFAFETNHPFSIEVWWNIPELVAYAPPADNAMSIFSKGNTSDGTGYNFAMTGVGSDDGIGVIDSIKFNPYSGGSLSATSLTYNPGQWYHLVYTYQSDGSATIYLDGVAIATRTGVSFPSTTDGAAMIGAVYNSSINNSSNPEKIWQPFLGLLDEVAIYDYALSPETISQHYEIGSIPEPGVVGLFLVALLGSIFLRRFCKTS